jgi:transcription termination factor Rho
MASMNSVDSMDFLLDKMRGTKSNRVFLDMMNS